MTIRDQAYWNRIRRRMLDWTKEGMMVDLVLR